MSSSALKAAVTGQVAAAQQPKTIFQYLEDQRVRTGLAAVAGKFLNADRMLRLCVNAVKKTPKLLECDPQTVLGAMMASAALGLEPNTVQQQAFLIPYKRRANIKGQWVDVYDCQFQIGARGFVTLAYRSPSIKSLFAETVHEGDRFEHMQGSETFLRFAKAMRDRGDPIGSFCHVRLASGEETMCLLPLEEVHKIRARSETYRSLQRDLDAAEGEKDRRKAEAKLAETPWVMWFDDMAAKSAIKKHAKQLPLATGDAMTVAAELDTEGDAGRVNLRAMADVEMARAVLDEGAELPRLENEPSEVIDQVSGEVFGTRERQAEAVQQHEQQPAQKEEPAAAPPPPPAAQAQTQAKPARGRAAAPAPAQQQAQERTEAEQAFDTYVARINSAQTLTEAEQIADGAEKALGVDIANSIRQATGLEIK